MPNTTSPLERLQDYDSLAVGQELTASVKNLMEFGAFFDIGRYRDALLPLNLLQRDHPHLRHPKDVFRQGEAFKVRIVSIDKPKRFVTLELAESYECRHTQYFRTNVPLFRSKSYWV